LIKLSFTNKDMAATLGVGPGAIRTMKSRLLKKLDLDGKLSLEEVVEEI
jgi:DNA-binding NarL/FixJ family response regulator